MKFSSKLLIENVISSFAEFGASLNVFCLGWYLSYILI